MNEIGMSLIDGLNGISGALQNRSEAKQTSESDFASVLTQALEQYRQTDQEGDYATLDLLSGATDDLSGTLITTEKAEVALNLTIAVRNKAVDAYKEIMNMQI